MLLAANSTTTQTKVAVNHHDSAGQTCTMPTLTSTASGKNPRAVTFPGQTPVAGSIDLGLYRQGRCYIFICSCLPRRTWTVTHRIMHTIQ
eukprot:5935375-Pyramimonas_sp.AAC.3